MQDRYIIQVKTRKNARWQSMDSYDNEQAAVQQCGIYNRSAEAGKAVHRVWSEKDSKMVYSRGWCDK